MRRTNKQNKRSPTPTKTTTTIGIEMEMEAARCSKKSIKHVNGKWKGMGGGREGGRRREGREQLGRREKGDKRERDRETWESQENESELQQLMHIKVSYSTFLPFCSAFRKKTSAAHRWRQQF